MAVDASQARHILESLRLGFIEQLPMRIAAIEQCWIDCNLTPNPGPALHELARLAHSLRGSAKTYGLMALGDTAGELETALSPWLASETTPDAEARHRLDRWVAALHDSARVQPDPVPGTTSPAPLLEARVPSRVYLLDDDAGQARLLANRLEHFGYHVEMFTTSPALQDQVSRARPAACILADDTPAGIEAGRALYRLDPTLPLLYASHRDDIEARLEAVRSGGQAYLRKPIDLLELVEELNQASGRTAVSPYRILIVEDDDSLARYYHAVLRDAGIEAMTVTAPLRTLQALDDFHPDVILMDVYMPQCTGAELAQVIQQRKTHAALPIVFLSGEGDPDIQFAALRKGGHDFLTKPVNADVLVRILKLRARQSRLTAASMVTDGMTGLLNHGRINAMLAAEVARARRSNTQLAVAMLELDHFREITDRHGPLAGDKVIRSLVRLLRARLRSSDLAGRFGDESFLVILPECDPDSARYLIDDVRERFSRIDHPGEPPEQAFGASFSIGLAVFPQANSAESLLLAATAALDKAKRQGRHPAL